MELAVMTFLNRYFDQVPEGERSSAAIAYLAAIDHLNEQNPEIADGILKELADQRGTLKMIASENYSSLATQLAMGNLLTDKYSEGFPFHRFYAGCENVDRIEALAVEELKKLFNAEHAYVQPHSGADANLVAFWAILVHRVQNPNVKRLYNKSVDELSTEEYEEIRQLMLNQKMMGLSLDAGGHLTHGFRHNVSAKMMQAVTYGVDPKTEEMDYKAIEEQAMREKPTILIAGYSAYPRLVNFAKMREIADKCGAVFVVDMAHFAGLVAGKVLTGEYDPVPYADIVTSTTHKTLRGPRGGLILCKKEYREVIDKGCPLVLGGPLPHVMAAKAVAFKEANSEAFQNYAKQVVLNAQAFAESLLRKDVRLVTGGTDNHLLVVDVMSSFGLTGRQAEVAMREALMTVNRNAIPNDPNGAWYTSGVRIGTPALTSRGLKENEMREIADLMVDLLKVTQAKVVERTGNLSKAKVSIDATVLERARHEVTRLLSEFPLYPELGAV
ncbi:Serine hydroxymethyltransferase [Candidatus Neptunochlamydia vexilliferae]|uniref:Serine hydroxymethyltransferase n=2 Tax=Candidatus Neptunichlamydia vexilliferae TaxID=1651774 RepID=A0ABS0B1M7_9BACT|nr:glycine hydroxymethyltransferase [Candidatus Neptunochlamydia vexilliferae]MBF5059586.1 Serine hydroxymethyltransferase [Candidatus Neptunochlamydia vexilliferae]